MSSSTCVRNRTRQYVVEVTVRRKLRVFSVYTTSARQARRKAEDFYLKQFGVKPVIKFVMSVPKGIGHVSSFKIGGRR